MRGKLTSSTDSQRLAVERLDPAVHRLQRRRSPAVLESHVRRPWDEISRHRGTALEVLDRKALGVERGRLVVGKRPRVLGKGRQPVDLRRLLDRGPVPLPVGADAELDAVAVKVRLVRERARSSAGSGSCGKRGPPRVCWELHKQLAGVSSIEAIPSCTYRRLESSKERAHGRGITGDLATRKARGRASRDWAKDAALGKRVEQSMIRGTARQSISDGCQ